MHGRQVALSLSRVVAHRSGHVQQNNLVRPLAALLPYRRRFATHFDGFGQFPGQRPPRGDTEKLYRILGVDKTASEREIKQAYRKQAMQHHPDRGGDVDAFKDISRAYEVLSNPEKKQIYDAYGEEGLEGMDKGGAPYQGADPFDLFSQIFGFNAAGRQPRGRPTTPNSTYELQVTLEELYTGTTRTIVFHRDVICSACNGVGGTERRTCNACGGSGQQVIMQNMGPFVQRVQTTCGKCSGRGHTIPPGSLCQKCKGKCTVKKEERFVVDVNQGTLDGREFRFEGKADEAPGHDTGDVVIMVRQKPHPTFQRAKDALVMRQKITLSEALCGFEFSVPFLDGEPLVIRSTPNEIVRPGDILVVNGKGMPKPNGREKGNLFVELDVEFPKTVAPEDHGSITQMLGGPPPQGPSANAEVASKVSRRRVQEVRRQFQEPEAGQEGAHGQQMQCHQQ